MIFPSYNHMALNLQYLKAAVHLLRLSYLSAWRSNVVNGLLCR